MRCARLVAGAQAEVKRKYACAEKSARCEVNAEMRTQHAACNTVIAKKKERAIAVRAVRVATRHQRAAGKER